MENSELMPRSVAEREETREKREVPEKQHEEPPSDWETERRSRVERILAETKEIDSVIFNAGEKRIENIMDVFEKIDRFETLAYGKELERSNVGEAGMNAITRRTYEGTPGEPPTVAYVKPDSGETTFEYDETTKTLFDVRYAFDKKLGRMAPAREASKRPDAEHIITLAQMRGEMRQNIAECYAIPVEEVPLFTSDEILLRNGIEARTTALREYAASRINEIIGWDVVPLTVIRPEHDGFDLVSVQEEVKATDPEHPPREIEAEDVEDILNLGSEHPGAKSMMRLACFDYLIKSTDRHPGNIIYDPASEQYHGIDNGLSNGISMRYEEENVSADPYISIPMEIIQEHKTWKLDNDALAQLRAFYEETKTYLSEREAGMKKKDVGIKHISSIFRLLYGHEKIAKEEALDFFRRIEYLVQNGRPPILQKTDQHEPGKLYDLLHISEEETTLPQRPKNDTVEAATAASHQSTR